MPAGLRPLPPLEIKMLTVIERSSKIELYGRAHDLLMAALAPLPRAMWHFRPTENDWTIHEIIIHITDSEANSYARCRRAIAEPGASVMAYDEWHWAKALNYAAQSPDEALDLFRVLRQNTYHLIQTLPEAVWGHTLHHPENGVMTLEDWLEVYTRHVPDHIEQMRRVHAAWQAAPTIP